MLKRIVLISYLFFSIVTLLIFSMLLQTIAKISNAFVVNFYIFEVNNPILLLGIVILTFLLGAINLIISSDSSRNISTFKITEEEASDIRSNEINEAIKNKYEGKVLSIKEIVTKAYSESKTDTDKVEKALWTLANQLEVNQGIVYMLSKKEGNGAFKLIATYAYAGNIEELKSIEYGMGINGQVIKTGEFLYVKEIPKGYMKIVSGLGETSPDYLLIVPFKNNEEKVIGVVEFAGFGQLNKEEVSTVIELVQSIFSTLTASLTFNTK